MSAIANRNLNFTGRLIIGGDYGASKEGGSVRNFLFDKDTGETIGEPLPRDGGSDYVCKGGLKDDPKEYTDGVISKAVELVRQNQDIIRKRPQEDQVISGLVAAAPAQTIFRNGNPVAPVVANIKVQGNPISVDYGKVKAGLLANGIKISSDFKNFVVNDMNMWTLQTGISHKDELKEGFKFATFINGGGFGTGFGEVLNVDGKNYLHVIATEEGHVKAGKGTLEAQKCSSPALIRNWGRDMGLDKEKLTEQQKVKLGKEDLDSMLDVLMSIGDSRIVTDPASKISVKLDDNQDDYLRKSAEVLSESSILKVEQKKGKAEIRVRPEKKSEAAQASAKTVNKYIDGLAFLSHVHACDGLNRIFLIGPLNSKGIASYVGGTEKLSKLVTERTFKYLDSAGANIARINDFMVVVDDSINDSKQALKTLTNGKFMQNTGNSYMIDVNKL